MGRLEQIEELKKQVQAATTALADAVGDVSQVQPAKKIQLWDDVVPILRTSIENLLKTGQWNIGEVKEIFWDKAMKAVFGPKVFDNIRTLQV